MNSYKLEDIEKLAADNGMRILARRGNDFVDVFLGEYRVSIFKSIFSGIPEYELLCTYTNVINGKSSLGNIDITGFVSGNRFFGTLNVVYENMNKKYKKLKKKEKTNEIKNCGGEYVVG
jgi:hypothetical protein